MNNLRPLLLTGLGLAIPLLVIGQTAPVNPTLPAESEAVILSPFVVTNQSDEGYRSQFTTAGSRLKNRPQGHRRVRLDPDR